MLKTNNLVGVSMVVTCYNLENYIEEALRSVFSQDYPGPMELIIVDDASQDTSVSVIESAIKKYGEGWDVTFIRNESNVGVSGATDKGWQLAKYDWIVEIDGDDIQYKNRCSEVAKLATKYPDAGMIVMSHACVNSKGEEFMVRYVVEGTNDATFYAESAKTRADIYIGRTTSFPVRKGAYGCSLVINKKVVNKWGPLNDENVKCFAQDPPWEFRAFLSYPILWSNKLACKYRSHSSNILNFERSYSTIEDYIENEYHMCLYDKKELMALNRMIDDAMKASSSKLYTDWNSEDVKACLQYFRQYSVARGLRADWWSFNFLKKLMILRKVRKQLPNQFLLGLLIRMLPIKVFAWIKMKKTEFRRK